MRNLFIQVNIEIIIYYLSKKGFCAAYTKSLFGASIALGYYYQKNILVNKS